ncbi:unnamed protein product [Ixodes hexagonus]
MAPPGSPMCYHQADKPHGFKTWLSTTVAPGRGTVYAVPELQLFDGAVEHTFPDAFTPEQHRILVELGLSTEEAKQLEANTRQQSLSKEWHSAREHRLTASAFGTVVKRQDWTEKGLRNLLEPKDLSRVRAIQYGRKNEPLAAE